MAEHTTIKHTFGPGRYYIGDICYPFDHKTYQALWKDKGYKPGFYDAGFCVGYTANGDGEYLGSDGHYYPVDVGNIGVVDLNKLPSVHDDQTLNENFGRVVNVKRQLVFENPYAGVFNINIDGRQVVIDTNYDSDEYAYMYE